jgi:hypothetical protein
MTHPVSVDTRRAFRTVIIVLARFAIAGAVYSACALGLTTTEAMSMTRLPLWAVLASTAVVAWLLRLLRQPIDTLADLIVYGGRGSGYSEARELVGRMAASLPVDEVLPQLAATIGHITRTPRAEVRFWLAADQRWRQVWPDMATPQGDPLTVGVRHLGTTIGEIEVDQVDGPLDDVGRRRLGGMAGPVGAALATVRLTYALRLRRTELERLTAAIDASTRRLLGARQAEQRRFRDELEEKVLRCIDNALAAPSVHAAADQSAVALDAVRAISRGVFPPRLAEAGLRECLQDWADTTPRATLHRVDDGWEPALRACLYFAVVTTATDLLTAEDARVEISVIRRAGFAVLSISARNARSMQWPVTARDRLEAFDGLLDTSTSEDSVKLSARLPEFQEPPAAPHPPRSTSDDPVGTTP